MSQEMQDYCEQTSRVTARLYEHLINIAPSKEAIMLDTNSLRKSTNRFGMDSRLTRLKLRSSPPADDPPGRPKLRTASAFRAYCGGDQVTHWMVY